MPEFLYLAMESPSTRRAIESMAASSAGQYNLGLAKVRRLDLPCPNLDEQGRVVQEFAELQAHIDRLKQSLHEANVHSLALRRAVLGAAFSGRLTGHRTDDEIIEELAQA